MPPWVLMWVLAGALWAASKAGTVVASRALWARSPAGRRWGYVFLWPGMNARGFLGAGGTPPAARDWGLAGLRAAAGLVLLLVAVPRLLGNHPLAAGWAGMVGVVLVLHFGLFDLVSLAWRRAGVDAPPLMDAPLRSTSLDELWGRRWNTGFHELAWRWVFVPLRRKAGGIGALAAAFVVSGLVHELVITVPAGAGHGGPTAYFALQAAGIALQRTRPLRVAGWARGVRGWAFTLCFALVPVPLLFPTAFVRAVVLPMLEVLGGR